MEELLMKLFLQLNDEEKDEVIAYIKTLPLNCGECHKNEGVILGYTKHNRE